MPSHDPFSARATLSTPEGDRFYYRLDALASLGDIDRLPLSIKVLLESCLRNCDGRVVTEAHVRALAGYDASNVGETEIAFTPGRVVLQDFTGVPCVVDLAAMRDAMRTLGGDPKKVNPLVPCDLVIDHSVQVDAYNSGIALTVNAEKEFERNGERYEFLKWGQQGFDNFRVVPPATGIVHQVNLEYLAKVTWERDGVLFPDSLVGTDSHTTMINGLGVLGWGVGGIEAEAVMLGQPIYMLVPEVVGMRLTGSLPEGTTATDLVLRITEILRAHGVVGKFVEFYGDGLAEMPLATRATIANMAPEYGATCGFFPVDDRTLDYLRLSGRDESLIETVEAYSKAQGFWRSEEVEPTFTSALELDMSTIEPALAGPKRPQDRIVLSAMQGSWRRMLADTFERPGADGESQTGRWMGEGGVGSDDGGLAVADPPATAVRYDGAEFEMRDGDVVVAAITSCTNTSNPSVMIGAGLVAQKARERGLVRKPWVKTSLAPGSKVVTDYLEKAGLLDDLEAVGFYLVGYGCTTCIGNSGPLPEAISLAIRENGLVATSVLSGNRNFEGRIHADVKANFLASPPLVVAYAIAGTVDIDLAVDPIGHDGDGQPVMLKDIWPTTEEVERVVSGALGRDQFLAQYEDVFTGSEEWQEIETSTGEMYEWSDASTYVQNPPFFEGMSPEVDVIRPVTGARCLALLGDSVTTDHISPAGAIKADSPAGQYLVDQGVPVSLFNSFGSRRGNDRVMTRGTFANIRIRNLLAPGTEGGYTTDLLDGKVKFIYDAAMNYREQGVPLVVLAGSDYGMGSSRDWAAKGTNLLGVKTVIAKSFERIHRSNLVFMGVLPLQFKNGEDVDAIGLTGHETFEVRIPEDLRPRQEIEVVATTEDGTPKTFMAIARVDTPVEVDYYRNGGILQTVLRKMAVS
ncbi:MAG: aconitate hydratase AcnA [Phycisphaerae bacterium]|nr:aconitate hydratase AcnA [Phycisphaerae bacterium]OUX02239.1 MAG: aconitate hydratase 1 [Phycisphaeraceae bacterium TMED231]